MLELNADVGEGYDDDAAILALVDAANIACGGHAGDTATMSTTVRLALAAGCHIGAHPSFPDKENFGRLPMPITPEALTSSLIEQIQALARVCRAEGASMVHVKPHGALYNQAASDTVLAQCVIDAIKAVDDQLVLVGLAGSQLLQQAAAAGLGTQAEAFADRRYEADGSLVSRQKPGAVIHDRHEAERQVRELMQGKVTCLAGNMISLKADTLCLHGDNPEALDFALRIRTLMEKSDD